MSLNNLNATSVRAPEAFVSALKELLHVRGISEPSEQIEIAGTDPFYKTSFKVGESIAAALTMVGVAANDLWSGTVRPDLSRAQHDR